jgi:CO/xanthine dehydrogenase Mo-binding subunit
MAETKTRGGEAEYGPNGRSPARQASATMMSHLFRLSFPPTPDFDSGLETTAVYDHPLSTMPHPERKHLGIFYPIVGHVCHIAVVDVDKATGKVDIIDYAAVHDNGTIVNPRTLSGQVLGGICNGIGTSLYEEFAYGADGQFLNANFAEFAMPTANEMPPNLKIRHVETPSPYTEYGVKGGGEGDVSERPRPCRRPSTTRLRRSGSKLILCL